MKRRQTSVNESAFPSQPETAVDISSASLETIDELLLPSLDFYHTPELVEARQAVLAMLTEKIDDPSRRQAVWSEYAIVGEQLVDSLDPEGHNVDLRAKAEIARTIHKALIFREAGNTLRYVEELDDAHTYADRRKFDDIATILFDKLESLVATLELSSETFLVMLKGELSDPNREHLRDLHKEGDDLYDLLDNAYELIKSEGSDAKEVFTRLGISESNI